MTNDKIDSAIGFIRLAEEIIRKEFICSKRNRDFILFNEKNPSSKIKEIRIKKPKETVSTEFVCLGIVPLPDIDCCEETKFGPQKLYPLINAQIEGITKSPDGIVFISCEKEPNKLLILLIELKSENDTRWIAQTYRGAIIARNLIDITSSLREKIDKDFLNSLEVSFLAFRYKSDAFMQTLPLDKIKIEMKFHEDYKIKYIKYPLSPLNQYKVEHFWNNFFSQNLNA